MEIKRLDIESEKLWEDFVEKNSGLKIQHSLNWKKVMEKSYKNCESYYYLGIEDNKVKFIAPFFLVKSKLFGNRLISLPFLDNGGFLGDINIKNLEELNGKIKEDFRDKKIEFIEIRLNSSIKEFNRIKKISQQLGFEKDDSKQQFIIGLTSEEDMWKRFHKHTRNDIRMAMKSGLKIKRIDNEKELKTFYKLYFKNMKYFGTPQHSHKFFKNLMEEFGERFVGFNCYYKDNLTASIIMLYKNREGYIMFNVSNPGYRKYRSNDILYWNVIKLAMKKRLEKIDLGQIDKEFEKGSREWSMYKFKKKWLGEIYDKVYFYYSLQEKSKDERKKKEELKKFRRMWKKLPSPIIKIMGPKIASGLGI